MIKTTCIFLLTAMILGFCTASDAAAQTTQPARQPASRPVRRQQKPTASQPASMPAANQPTKPASQPAAKQRPPLLPIGSIAPKFEARTLSELEIRFPDDHAGQLVLLHMWASWCPSCGRDYPYWVKAQEEYGDQGLTLLGISLDYKKKIDPVEVQIAMDERGGTWEVVYEGARRIEKLYVTPVLPTLYLIDGDTGRILEAGDNLRRGRIMKTLATHMAEKFPDRFSMPSTESQPAPDSLPPASQPVKP